jgi:hydroxyacyl-ACP dehydratase HTD2-like protein with hotdog domain
MKMNELKKERRKIMYKKRKSEKTKTRKEEGEMNEKLKQVQKCFFFL